MRYGPDQKERTRAKILEAAGKVFRRRGYHASGVDAVMKEAGLTAGGFYAHFSSKEALLAEALVPSGAEVAKRLEARLDGLSGTARVDAFLNRYLSTQHCSEIEDGCPLVALVSEISRADDEVKQRFEGMVRALGERLIPPDTPDRDVAEGRAYAALALCVGGLGLARSVADEELAERILESCRNQARIILTASIPPAEQDETPRNSPSS